jgi:hypothetical protein
MRAILVVMTFLFGCAAWLHSVLAEEQASSYFPLGTYQPFGLWEQVQLGATSLVNPSLAGTAAVVNSYSLEDLTKEASVEQVAIEKLKKGDAIFARETTKGQYVKLKPDEVGKLVAQLKNGEKVEGIVVLTYQKIPPAQSDKLIVWPLGN